MDEEKKEINVPNIGVSEKKRQFIEREKQEYLRELQEQKEIRRKAVKRKKLFKKIGKIVFITGVVAIVGVGLDYVGTKTAQKIKFQQDPLGTTASDIDENMSRGMNAEEEIMDNYQKKYEALAQQMQDTEEFSNDRLSQTAKDTQIKIDNEISKLSFKIKESFGTVSDEELHSSCIKRTDDKQSYFYKFSAYDKQRVTLNWLKQYFDVAQIENVYDSLSEEDINALIVSTTYRQIESYEGGSNNKEEFLKNFGYNSDKSEEEKFQEASTKANDVAFRVAKESLEQKLGYSLDVEEKSVGKGR